MPCERNRQAFAIFETLAKICETFSKDIIDERRIVFSIPDSNHKIYFMYTKNEILDTLFGIGKPLMQNVDS